MHHYQRMLKPWSKKPSLPFGNHINTQAKKHNKSVLTSSAFLKIPLKENTLSERAGDRVFKYFVLSFGLIVILLGIGMGIKLVASSMAIWKEFGLSFLWGRDWNPVTEEFGALPFIYGTLVTSAISLLIAVPLGVGSAIYLAELAPRKISDAITFLIELLAAIPSVILGLMAIFTLVPLVRWVSPFLMDNLGWIPLFDGYPIGVGMLTAALILTIMILPYITSISRDVIMAVPQALKEAAFGLGATHWETVRKVILPYAGRGIMGSVFLALGRALGETMAVTMVIGNSPKISASLLKPAYTMAAVIANEFAEADSDLYIEALIAIGLVLFVITIIVNGLARLMIFNMNKGRT